MVDIRATLDAAVARGVLDDGFAARLTDIAKTLFYKERRWDAILRLGSEGRLSPAVIRNFADWPEGGRIDQKRSDALAMTAAIQAKLAASVASLTVSYRFHNTGYHQAALQQSLKHDKRIDKKPDNPLAGEALLRPPKLR
jgi:hypothetical protein